MKNILDCCVLPALYLMTNPVFAEEPLCIALTNFSNNPVHLSGERVSKDEKLAQTRETVTLGKKLVDESCYGEGDNTFCDIGVDERISNNHSESIWVMNYPRGSLIVYYGGGRMSIKTDAKVKCVE